MPSIKKVIAEEIKAAVNALSITNLNIFITWLSPREIEDGKRELFLKPSTMASTIRDRSEAFKVVSILVGLRRKVEASEDSDDVCDELEELYDQIETVWEPPDAMCTSNGYHWFGSDLPREVDLTELEQNRIVAVVGQVQFHR